MYSGSRSGIAQWAVMASKGIPVIDMQKLEGLAAEIVKASEECGIFRISNHGVPAELLAEMKAVMASVFDLPEEIKSRTDVGEHGKGYVRFNPPTQFLESLSLNDISSAGDFCDRLDISLPQREVIYKYIKAIRDLAGVIGRKLMEGYGLTGDLFEGWCCQMRMNKYQFGPESVGSCGVSLHTDPSFLTILYDDESVSGLQVVDKYTGELTPVDPLPGTIAVNMGDIAKAWSNGRFCNVKHSVTCVEPKTRYSIVLFVLGPNDNQKKVEAPAQLVDLQHPRLYVPIDIKEYRDVRSVKRLPTGDALDLFTINNT